MYNFELIGVDGRIIYKSELPYASEKATVISARNMARNIDATSAIIYKGKQQIDHLPNLDKKIFNSQKRVR